LTNLAVICAKRADALIPFKKNARQLRAACGRSAFIISICIARNTCRAITSGAMSKPHFPRSKRRYGSAVRSKTEEAMKNEVLAKFVCWTVTCVIQAMYEMGVNPVFWADQAQAS